MCMGWSNWSGSVVTNAQVLRPKSEDELSEVVRMSSSVRMTGASHSFMPLCASETTIVSLADLSGTIRISSDRQRVTVPAGKTIRALTAELYALGLALPNQGDVNVQSIAGSIATATHGTGKDFGSLSTLACGFRLVRADGEACWCDETTLPNLFQAQRLSLGMFGIATEIELDVVPAFYLSETITTMSIDEIRERFDEFENDHRHVEFFIFPYSDTAILKTLAITDPCQPPKTTTDMDEAGFRRVLHIGKALPVLVPALQKLVMRSNFDSQRHGAAHVMYPSDRDTRFEEMEYELPRANGFAALIEAMDWVRHKRVPISFPFEFRVVGGDDIWMSPMNAGPVASISMHQYNKMPWADSFAEVEKIFRRYGGRPHWAKRHNLTRADVDALYPMAERYRVERRLADPESKFLNPHLAELFS